MIIWCSTSSPGQLWILNNLFFSLNSLHTIFDKAYFPLFFSISSPGRILPFFILLPSLPSFPPSFLSSFFSFFFLFLNLYSDALGLTFSSVQSLSRVQLFETLWTAARQVSLSITNSQSLLKLMSIESVMSSNHFNLCPLLLLSPSIFPSIRVFSNESVIRNGWPKYCSFSFSISPSNEYSGLISFRMDWMDLIAVQGTHKSLLQHHGSRRSILRHSVFFMI